MTSPRRRRRIDWEEERRRTEKSRMKGLRYSTLSFLMAFFFLMMTKTFHREYSLNAPMIVLGALFVGNLVLFFLFYRRNRSDGNGNRKE